MRYQVLNCRDAGALPVFSAPWRWLASWMSSLLAMKWDYYRLEDSLTGEVLLEWAKGSKNILTGNMAAVAIVNKTPSGHMHTLLYGTVRHGSGHAPAGGHRPVTIINGENDAAADAGPGGPDLGFSPKYHRRITQGPHCGCWTASSEDGPSPIVLLGVRLVSARFVMNQAALNNEREKIVAAGGRVI